MAGLKFPAVEPRYNIAPTQPVLCVLSGPFSDDASDVSNEVETGSPNVVDIGPDDDPDNGPCNDGRGPDSMPGNPSVRPLSWGLIPAWEKQPAKARRHFNARSETAADKPSFREAFKKRRCLIVADGFYEWKTEGKAKQPFYITHAEHRTLWFAGLWEPGDPERGPGDTCTILTTEANRYMRSLHHRMPVILRQCDLATWLANDLPNNEAPQSLLTACEEDVLTMRPVSTYVNNANHQGPDCLGPPPPQQTSLF